MSNKITEEINKIKLPKDLSQRSKVGISQAKIASRRKRWNMKGIAIAVAFLLSVGAFFLFQYGYPSNNNQLIVTKDGGVKIPPISLPKNTESANMIGLIVYNGKIYTQTRTEIDPEHAKNFIGEKLGTTKGNIDEWSSQTEYDTEFASNIPRTDVYTVKGYDKNFRIMTYNENLPNDEIHNSFYENLNGITITNGKDLFGKLKIEGNVSAVFSRSFSDWDQNVKSFKQIEDMETVNTFIKELNVVKPLPSSSENDPIGDYRNDEQFKELTIHLNDGSRVQLILLKEGYIYYGSMPVYFQMNEDVFMSMWQLL